MADEEIAVTDVPSVEAERFVCPRCHAYAAQTWFQLQYAVRGSGSMYAIDTPDPLASTGQWRFCRCESCQRFSTWRDSTLVFPADSDLTTPSPHGDMPELAEELYREARSVLPHSRRAGAALARASLEALLKVIDSDAPSGARLDDRIARLAPRVSTSLWKLLSLVRHLGNKSLHIEEEPDGLVVILMDDDETELPELLFTAINDLVDELITKPKRVDAWYEKMPAGVRADAERKAEEEPKS